MALSWVDYSNGEGLGDVRNKINTFNNDVVTDVNANTAAITTLNELGLYQFSRVTGSSTTSDTYSPLNSLVIPNAPAGTYEFKLSMTFTYNTTNKSSYFNISTTGGSSWMEIRREAKDSTDIMNESYTFPVEHTGGDIDLRIEFRVETAGNLLTVLASNLIVERKL